MALNVTPQEVFAGTVGENTFVAAGPVNTLALVFDASVDVKSEQLLEVVQVAATIPKKALFPESILANIGRVKVQEALLVPTRVVPLVW